MRARNFAILATQLCCINFRSCLVSVCRFRWVVAHHAESQMSRFHAQARSALLLPGIIVTLAATAAPDVWADPISVVVDYAKVMQVSRPADIVIIGNAAIADITIRDNRTLIITGRSFGTTNLIVLDKEGQTIADEIITVSAPNNQVVTVHRRSSRQSYSCTPDCAPMLVVGDNIATFDAVNSQIKAHGSLSDTAANR